MPKQTTRSSTRGRAVTTGARTDPYPAPVRRSLRFKRTIMHDAPEIDADDSEDSNASLASAESKTSPTSSPPEPTSNVTRYTRQLFVPEDTSRPAKPPTQSRTLKRTFYDDRGILPCPVQSPICNQLLKLQARVNEATTSLHTLLRYYAGQRSLMLVPPGDAMTPALAKLYTRLWGYDWETTLPRQYQALSRSVDNITEKLLATFFLEEVIGPIVADGLPHQRDKECAAATSADKHRYGARDIPCAGMQLEDDCTPVEHDQVYNTVCFSQVFDSYCGMASDQDARLIEAYETSIMETCCATFDPYNIALQAHKEHTRKGSKPVHTDWRAEWAESLRPCVKAAIEVKRLLILNGSDYDLIWTSQSQDRTPTSDTFVKIDIFVGDVKNRKTAEQIAVLVVGQ
ncbi:hypothetical protein LTR95_013187 [Oleoguttula sp. CCFEE 5521]